MVEGPLCCCCVKNRVSSLSSTSPALGWVGDLGGGWVGDLGDGWVIWVVIW